jgi:hypothetical protein
MRETLTAGSVVEGVVSLAVAVLMTVAGFAALHDVRIDGFVNAVPMTSSTPNVRLRAAAGVFQGQREVALIALPHVDECAA